MALTLYHGPHLLGELLPRIARNRDFFECRMCSWADRCWALPA